MYPHSFWWHYLWIAPDILLLVTAGMIVCRGLFYEFPMFLAYVMFESLQGITLFILDHSSAISGVAYWNTHWAGLLVSIALRFAVINEIFSSVFRPYRALTEFSRLLLRWTTIALLFAAVILTASAAMDTPFLLSGVHVLNRAVGLVQSGLLVFLFLFCAYFRLSWRAYTYGIAVGLGIFASVDLATAALRVWVGTPAAGSYVLDFVTMATYHCCVLIWLVYMLVPEAASESVAEVPHHNLEQWNAEMQRLLLR
jgi:hypothetical protein